jgi:hypothetical protein
MIRPALYTIFVIAAALCLATPDTALHAQQIANTAFSVSVENPSYESNSGPLVLIDEGHHNFHTRDGRYRPFASVLEADGYRVDRHVAEITEDSLAAASVLVVSNALHETNVSNWELPTPSAFTAEEIQTIVGFVEAGGGLLLIADHMPFPGAAEDLAAEFDVTLRNGFAFSLDAAEQSIHPTVFRRREFRASGRSQGRVNDHPITRGRSESELINQVASFTGSAFRVRGSIESLLTFRGDTIMYLPDVAWQFSDFASSLSISGWSQGAAIERGEGRVVLFGEAAMLTSQQASGVTIGFGAPEALDNQQLLLNILHWLTFDI